MRKNINKTDAPKNDDLKVLNLGDQIKFQLTVYIKNTKYKKLKYSEQKLMQYIDDEVQFYFATIGEMQNEEKINFYEPIK